MAPDPMKGAMGARDAAARRAMILLELKRLADTGRGIECLPRLVDAAGTDRAVLALHVWLIDQAVFGSGRERALNHLRRACEWTGARPDRSPGTLTVGWLLDERTGGARLLAWLTALACDRTIGGWTPPPPDPYA
ncbi:hypothetical protein [Bifidobacterium castoris]|uniref:Uncharacterized protein n=1 Tax=Bifidobacterium castoris TaxID=2306972 RepID=A0A430FAI6_9BIFI|nr:hypothetical protein [Bifidobacterium castoris]RSX49845.1 hypothetical protein D2E22_0306 [Bifidobacterium castoris]